MWRSGSLVLVVAFLLASGHGRPTHAQQPTATPPPAADPVAVVRTFYDALNRSDLVAADLFADEAVYEGAIVCSPVCTGKAEITAQFGDAWLPYLPITVAYELVSPTVVLVRGQGRLNRSVNNYFIARFEVAGDRIVAFHAELPMGQCVNLPPSNVVCAPYPPLLNVN
jgi:hypothetical protein